MNTMLESAKLLAAKFMEKPQHVGVIEDNVKRLAEKIKEASFTDDCWSTPITLSSNPEVANIQLVLYELMASAVNYKYWYGKHDIRSNDSSSTKMYEALNRSFMDRVSLCDSVSDSYCQSLIEDFIRILATERFPMISERISHLEELLKPAPSFSNSYPLIFVSSESLVGRFIRALGKELTLNPEKLTVDPWMENLVTYFPGFGQDMFLKRANLFFMMLYRRRKWFAHEMDKLIIPADYHIPKMLRYFGVIYYSDKLNEDVHNSVLIPEGSLVECEIRAASIVVCEMMRQYGLNAMRVDEYLWNNRKQCQDPFHLTITTNY